MRKRNPKAIGSIFKVNHNLLLAHVPPKYLKQSGDFDLDSIGDYPYVVITKINTTDDNYYSGILMDKKGMALINIGFVHPASLDGIAIGIHHRYTGKLNEPRGEVNDVQRLLLAIVDMKADADQENIAIAIGELEDWYKERDEAANAKIRSLMAESQCDGIPLYSI